jgi:hypothetical protein
MKTNNVTPPQTVAFTDEETLAANADGLLTDQQRAALLSERGNWLGIGIATVFTAIFLTISIPWIFEYNGASTSFVWFVTTAGVTFTLYCAWQWRRFAIDLQSPVESGEGVIYLDVRRGKPTVSIGDLHFLTTPDRFMVFKNGDPYRIYYAPGSMTVLSAEWLASTQSSVLI